MSKYPAAGKDYKNTKRLAAGNIGNIRYLRYPAVKVLDVRSIPYDTNTINVMDGDSRRRIFCFRSCRSDITIYELKIKIKHSQNSRTGILDAPAVRIFQDYAKRCLTLLLL